MTHRHHSFPDRYELEHIEYTTWSAIEEIINSTYDAKLVGVGRDAKHLQYSGVSVTSIKKLKHPRLFDSYCARRKQISRNLSHSSYICRNISDLPEALCDFKYEERHQDMNEVFLFHGTTEQATSSILAQGFNIQFSRHNALFGRGIYFAEQFTKADQYSDRTQYREPLGTELTVLLCRVILGNAYICHKKDAKRWTRPPCLTCKQKDCCCWLGNKYNSVVGTGHGMLFREFVVYDGAQCYPEYLIKYTRRHVI